MINKFVENVITNLINSYQSNKMEEINAIVTYPKNNT